MTAPLPPTHPRARSTTASSDPSCAGSSLTTAVMWSEPRRRCPARAGHVGCLLQLRSVRGRAGLVRSRRVRADPRVVGLRVEAPEVQLVAVSGSGRDAVDPSPQARVGGDGSGDGSAGTVLEQCRVAVVVAGIQGVPGERGVQGGDVLGVVRRPWSRARVPSSPPHRQCGGSGPARLRRRILAPETGRARAGAVAALVTAGRITIGTRAGMFHGEHPEGKDPRSSRPRPAIQGDHGGHHTPPQYPSTRGPPNAHGLP